MGGGTIAHCMFVTVETSQLLRSELNKLASSNIPLPRGSRRVDSTRHRSVREHSATTAHFMCSTLETSQLLRSEVNEWANMNISAVSVTLETSQLLRSELNLVAPSNIPLPRGSRRVDSTRCRSVRERGGAAGLLRPIAWSRLRDRRSYTTMTALRVFHLLRSASAGRGA